MHINRAYELLIKSRYLQNYLKKLSEFPSINNDECEATQNEINLIELQVELECANSDIVRNYFEFKRKHNYIFQINTDRQLLKISRKGDGPTFSVIYFNNDSENQNANQQQTKVVLYSGKQAHLLGKGAFGKVKLCQDYQSREFYALKVQSTASKKPFRKEELEREVENLRVMRMLHQSIILPGTKKHYICMRLIDGMELYDVVESNLDKPKVLLHASLLAAEALQRIHNDNMIHRDVKFENFVYDKTNNRCHLIDLAFLAKVTRDDELDDVLHLGTPDYLAPELAGAQPMYTYSKRSDIYAFGTILNTVAANILDTKNANLVKTLFETCAADYTKPLKDVSKDLTRFIRGATQLLRTITQAEPAPNGMFFSTKNTPPKRPAQPCSPERKRVFESSSLVGSSPSKRLFIS